MIHFDHLLVYMLCTLLIIFSHFSEAQNQTTTQFLSSKAMTQPVAAPTRRPTAVHNRCNGGHNDQFKRANRQPITEAQAKSKVCHWKFPVDRGVGYCPKRIIGHDEYKAGWYKFCEKQFYAHEGYSS